GRDLRQHVVELERVAQLAPAVQQHRRAPPLEQVLAEKSPHHLHERGRAREEAVPAEVEAKPFVLLRAAEPARPRLALEHGHAHALPRQAMDGRQAAGHTAEDHDALGRWEPGRHSVFRYATRSALSSAGSSLEKLRRSTTSSSVRALPSWK